MQIENGYKPNVNLNIKMVDNGLFMVYNTNIGNFYLNERNKHLQKKVIVIMDKAVQSVDLNAGASAAVGT